MSGVSPRAVASFAAASVLFGGTFVGAKAGLEYFPPLLFVALRFDLAAAVLAAYVVYANDGGDLVPRTRGDVAGVLATGVLVIGLANAALFVGQQSATSGVASTVMSLNPILTPVFAALLLSDERLSARGAVGLTLGLVGVTVVVSPDPTALFTASRGKLLLLAGATAGALGSVLIRRADGRLPSTVRTAWGLPVAALLCHALSLAAGESAAAVRWRPEAVLALVFVAVFAGAAAYVAYFGLIDATGAIRANLIFYVSPLVATLGGGVLLGEPVSPVALGGFLVVFAGFALLASESVDRPRIRPSGASARRSGGGERPGACEEPAGFRSD